MPESITDQITALKARVDELEKRAIPVGTIIASAVPWSSQDRKFKELWLPCDGRACGGTEYARRSGNSRVPDLRKQFLRGTYRGRSILSKQSDAFKSHLHTFSKFQGRSGADDLTKKWRIGNVEGFGRTHRTSAEGENETRPMNVAVAFFIKVKKG